VLDAGRTFVPIDPPTAISSYDRTMSLIKATGCSTILVPHSFMSIASYSQFITTLSNEIGAQIIELRIDTDNTLMLVPLGDSQIDSLAIGPAPPSLPLPSSTYAYAIATSGTTGEPKIVWVPHASAQSNAEAIAQYWNLGQQDSHLMIAPVTFDPWIIDICVTLGCGAKLVMVEDTIRHNSAKLAALLPRMLLSSIQCTPSYLWSLGSDGITSLLATARNVSLGGEPFPMRHQVLSWLGPSAATRRRDIRFFNLYGITEMSIVRVVVMSIASGPCNIFFCSN
jgi:non-ribosomal peptide synthetase component F